MNEWRAHTPSGTPWTRIDTAPSDGIWPGIVEVGEAFWSILQAGATLRAIGPGEIFYTACTSPC
eukprot:1507270-Prorocentrum_lima.AAC.1